MPHCPVYREEGRATAQDGSRGGRPSDGPGAGLGSRRRLTQQCSCSRVAPTRLLLEENTFQALAQEPLLKRPRTVEDALLVAGGNLLYLPFPKKLWRLVNSSQFRSIWWEKDGTSIGLNEKLFQKETLDGTPTRSNCARTCTHPICLTNCFTVGVGPGPVRVLSKFLSPFPTGTSLQFYSSPLFRKDCPHLLKKKRVGVKAAQRRSPPAGHQRSSGPLWSTSGSSNRSWWAARSIAVPLPGTGASLPLPAGQERVRPSRHPRGGS
ncbi:unnamed protein product [Nyctereutes procyonoides]|uniref:(raccoon dog) hypothetical protein n=1 Tax=Nyctereutes procyonoides TaxID=34880 RepID=A0A811XU75_NYCPR|nr:unnamed protein product [Nyctereutes procyonoides]